MCFSLKKNSFVVKQNKATFWVLLFFLLFSIVFPMFTFDNDFKDAFTRIFFHVLFGGFSLYFIVWMIYCRRWMLKVEGETIFIRKMFGSRHYTVQEITKADVRRDNIVLYTGNIKMAKVYDGCEGFEILLERLKSENIAFYRKGKLLETVHEDDE